MRSFVLISCTLLLSIQAFAQSSYSEAIQQGDAAYNRGQYKLAINKYFAAEAFDPSKDEVVKAKVNRVFDRIERLREEADEAKRRAEDAQLQAHDNLDMLATEQEKTKIALVEMEKAKAETQEALSKAQKLINNFYFYANRFAIAYGQKNYENVFYFIDKNGNEVKKLGRWRQAEQFNETGFAKVKKRSGNEIKDYLLDTLGTIYPVAYNLKHLTPEIIALDLSQEDWDTFPIEVLEQVQLQVLLINGSSSQKNSFRRIPDEIVRLKKLKTLQLANCSIDSLGFEAGKLTNLLTLDLSGNKLAKLPNHVGELKNLSMLNLSHNILTDLPIEIGQLDNLSILDLSHNSLVELPIEITELLNLSHLNLSVNRLTALPKEIKLLHKLSSLDLSLNKWNDLSQELSKLRNLSSLQLYNSHLTELPVEIGQLTNLVHLGLGSNKLTKLPIEIRQLTNLAYLDLDYNELTELPTEIGQLTNLANLSLGWNRLMEVPAEIGQISRLETLDLRSNSISTFPPEVAQLTNLRDLDLSANKLTFKEIEKIKELLPNCYIHFDNLR